MQLGISFESLSEISQQVTSIASSTNEQGSVFMEFSNSMLTSFYNYSSSFSKSLEEIVKIASSWDKSVRLYNVTENTQRFRYDHASAVLDSCFSVSSSYEIQLNCL